MPGARPREAPPWRSSDCGHWAAGIDGPVFWGIVMAVASALPAVGTAELVRRETD